MPTPEPFTPEDADLYSGLKVLVREQMPDGRRLVGEMRSIYDRFFADQQIILSRRDRYRLFLLIAEELMNEMKDELAQLKP